jgi:diguanylate cyclase (GGDEF)-like protein/PAS domain S-box-containing protein
MIQDDIIRLIVIEESANDAEIILNSLRKARYPIRPRHVEDDEDLQKALTEHEWDLVISVPQVGDFTCAQVCEMISSSKQDIPIIVLVDKPDGKNMSALLSAGAKQVIPSSNDGCLQIVVGRELENLFERRRRKHLEQLYKESQKHNKMLLESSRDAIAYVHDGMHIYANPSYLKMFDYKNMEDIEGLPIMDLVSLEDQVKFKEFMREFMTDDKEEERQMDLEGLKAGKKRFKLKMEVSHAIYDSERCIQVIIRDQSQSQELELKLKEVSRRDQLTGLFNRQYFIELLEKSLAKAMETHTRSVLFYIELDNFESIRDNFGLGGADPIIQNVGKILHKLSQGGTLARFGENIFVLLLPDKDGKKYAIASELAQKMCKAIEASVTEIGNQSMVTTCSIGIAQVLASATSPQDILTDAHTACGQASKKGGNTYEIYKAVVKSEQGGMRTSDIAKLIETAIEEKRLSLRYQPIVSLHGDNQEIYEVFLRMVDANGQPVPTGELFSTAEKANLSINLDKWVLEQSIKSLVEQEKKGHKTHLFIKLSDQAIRDENVLLFIRKLLKSTQIPGERIVIELSESTAISQIKLAKTFITQLKSFDCKSALEHFGTGLNSATTLKHLPVDYVKIDSSFSKGLSTNTENQTAVQDIVKLAHDSNKLIIAEAVEDANSLTILWQSEVDFAQGHYIQEPMEEMEFDFSDEE